MIESLAFLKSDRSATSLRMLLANWVRDPTLLKAAHSASTFTHKLVGRDVKFYVSTSGGMAKNHYVRGDTPYSPLV
ncbi:MAG: hypothetical protein QNJ47_21785, partial [Nostocaceae cyanobacterium]|nr:hypothetical protein [Nostocaceae cyanobacterium]